MPRTPDWKLECFDWLPLEKWSVETLIAAGEHMNKNYCKICDRWVYASDLEPHVKGHVREMKTLRTRRAAEGKTRREEALALAREEKRLQKETA